MPMISGLQWGFCFVSEVLKEIDFLNVSVHRCYQIFTVSQNCIKEKKTLPIIDNNLVKF